MRKSITEALIIEKIAKKHGISISLAKKVYNNTLLYNIVQAQIIEQADFLILNNVELF